MKVWNCVYLYGGCIEDQKVFRTKASATKWFEGHTEKLGGKEACDIGDYHVSNRWLHFFDSMVRSTTEVKCSLVEEEE